MGWPFNRASKRKPFRTDRPAPSAGDFSYFGGDNSKTLDPWGDDSVWNTTKSGLRAKYEGKKMGRHESAALWTDDLDGKKPDRFGRTGFQKSEPVYGGENESAESMTRRGARIQINDDLAILGPTVGKNGRAPIGAADRDRIEENAKYQSGAPKLLPKKTKSKKTKEAKTPKEAPQSAEVDPW